jgi:hypothetical protein
MLNKIVCKRCAEEENLDLDVSSLGDIVVKRTDNREWTTDDEKNWLAGFVFCNADITSLPEQANVKGLPPRWCIYSLEHIVSQPC